MNREQERLVNAELDRICHVLRKNMERYGENFPSACATAGVYRIKKNDDWTNGFWTGMLWMAYLHTGDESFRRLALKNVDSFIRRLDEHFILDHHDIGFLYSPSVEAAWRIEKDESLKTQILRAADVLASRFQEKGGFIQAWGALDNPNEYRLIIDSLLNLPLLYTASEISKDGRYRAIADTHYERVIANIVRQDGSTFHTFYFDPATGEPSHGATHQGFSDNSCWARGQAWAIYGMMLHRRVSGSWSEREQAIWEKVLAYFEEHLPKDGMPYWDLVFSDGSDEPRDSSALAVAACGLLEAGKIQRGLEMAETCLNLASSKEEPTSEGLLLHGVYAYAEGKGVDEPNLWGDYFYMEALMRLVRPDWTAFL